MPGGVSVPLFRTPPYSEKVSATVSPVMDAVTPFSILNATRRSLPLTVKMPAPGPSMSRFWVISSSPLVSVMVPVTLLANAMVSPGLAVLIVARNDPAPPSLVFVTMSMLSKVRRSRTSRRKWDERRPPSLGHRSARPRLRRRSVVPAAKALESGIGGVSRSNNRLVRIPRGDSSGNSAVASNPR